jgi:prepilin signal peptidase PulO-like enzyme (type II secretory pathway)
MVVAVMVALLAGPLHGLLRLTSGADSRSEIPFGIHMAVSAIVASLYGEALLTWYLSRFDRA